MPTTRRLLLTSLALAVAALFGYQLGRQTAAPPAMPPAETKDRPLIGVTHFDRPDYVAAIHLAGGLPVVLPQQATTPESIARFLETLDGLLMPGGPDIPPSEYGEPPHETVKLLDDQRYQFEKALGSAWIQQTRKPLLGICLGSQWLNVLHGGSLVQDIPSEFHVNHRDTSHPVTLSPDSRLRTIFGTDQLEVNSFHHQAVRRLGTGLRVAATSPEGIIEATEGTDPSRFLVGVQWHPEKMISKDPAQLKIIQALVDAARDARAASNPAP